MSWNFIVSDYFVVEISLSGISLLAVNIAISSVGISLSSFCCYLIGWDIIVSYFITNSSAGISMLAIM